MAGSLLPRYKEKLIKKCICKECNLCQKKYKKKKVVSGNNVLFEVCFDENLNPLVDCSGCEDPVLKKDRCIDICYNNFR